MSSLPVILAARRTPIGAFQGVFNSVSSAHLGAAAIRTAVADSGLTHAHLDEVIMGCVLMAGQGQAPARQAMLNAGLSSTIPSTTINKMCGSGMKAVMIACDQLYAGNAHAVVAGGMESMTNAPYLLPKARSGYRMGHGEILDHMFYDGLQNPYDGKMMGHFADATATKYGFTREQQDAFASESVKRAQHAVANGFFRDEITSVTFKTRKGEQTVDADETPGTCDSNKIPALKPAFNKDGTVTAASSSSISDGAAALIIATEALAHRANCKPLARIVAYASHAHEPEWFTTAPGGAINKVLDKAQWKVSDVDLFEINEAFACVTMAAMHDIGIDRGKVNVNGGACALGHPIGATGARILVTLIHSLKARSLKRGVAALCIGGGEATAMAVEIC
ncbi:MAG TPA: acetyl-CoA C-acyltransferase [Steroidobacteraceae bacterium]|nr:acetyl-CoA C-acyltransferase [Steroidobacteraceae bacterium]